DAPHRLKFCQFQSGNSTNVIADRAHIKGSLRTFSDADFHALRASMQALAADAARAQGVICHLDIHDGYPALVNDAALLETAAAHLPIERIPESSFLGEDFSFIARRVPAVMFRLGLGTDIPLHAATFDFDERALVPGVHLFQTLAKMEA
ncbi:MAG: M20/M25/M40 family metallo-hydrolase, partial [Christensenellales bacterium]